MIQPQRLPARALLRAQFDPATTETTTMSTVIDDANCPHCGGYMRLNCLGLLDLPEGKKFDLLWECADECGEPALNAFVPLSDFQTIE